jgi:hypothetical protein
MIRTFVEQVVTETDSATLVAQGLPYSPSGGPVLVTSSTVCSKVVAALNSTLPAGDPRRVSKAYVFKLGNAAYAGVGDKSKVDNLAVVFLNSKYKWLTGMAAMN